jgi:hypothetical protein
VWWLAPSPRPVSPSKYSWNSTSSLALPSTTNRPAPVRVAAERVRVGVAGDVIDLLAGNREQHVAVAAIGAARAATAAARSSATSSQKREPLSLSRSLSRLSRDLSQGSGDQQAENDRHGELAVHP